MKFKKILVVESVKDTQNHLNSVRNIREVLEKRGESFQWINYDELSSEFFQDVDLVVMKIRVREH